jgi:hypothetical protein
MTVRHVLSIILCTLLSAILIPCAAASQMYTDISLVYYTHFITDPDAYSRRHENFQRYHQVKQTVSWDDSTLAFNFNLYEAVNGPVADHTITPYTIEYNSGDFEATGLVLIDVYNKIYSYINSVLDMRYHWQLPIGAWQLHIIPRLNLVHNVDQWEIAPPWLGIDLQRSYGQTKLSLGINTLDTKDTLLLADKAYVFTGRIEWPTWGENRTNIGINWRPAGESTSSHLWFDFRVQFDHWFYHECLFR